MSDMKPIIILCVAMTLTACTQDELSSPTGGVEGAYPLQIAAVTLSVEGGEAQPWGAPHTRVSETEDGTGSKWDGDEEIDVQIEGSTETATYTVQDDGTVSSDAPLYWSDSDNHTVNAWYPATNTPLDLSDQTNGLAYLLHGKGTGNYENPVELIFTHSLAKVRVTPSNDIANDEVTSLQLYTYTTCTYTQGKINTEDAQKGWIKMKKCEYNGVTCWEANVVPDCEITKLIANNDDKERELSASINPVAGRFYNITLNKDKGFTVSEDGKTYTVYTADGLLAWNDAAQIDLTLNCNLTADINLTGTTWTPIGTNIIDSSYKGTFDGGNHTISGLTVTGSDQSAGLFGYIDDGGTVKNVKLEKVQIKSDYQYAYVGGVAGYSEGNIENCSVSGSVSGNGSSSDVGGVVGLQFGGSITGCSSSAPVKGSQRVGGVAGLTDNRAILTGCYTTRDVTLESNNSNSTYAGGVVGANVGGSTLIACYATGNVTGTGTGTGSIYVGGVTGDNFASTLTACYHAAGTVSGPDRATGGVTGRNFNDASGASVITACYWQNDQAKGIGYNQPDTGETTKVEGNWTDAMNAMNAALQSAGSEWRYELTGELPTLKKQ